MNIPSPDAGIPLLTEVIEGLVAEPIPTPPPAAVTANPPTPPRGADPLGDVIEIKTLLTGSEEDWSRLERKIRERILRQIVARVDSALEQRVRDSLADVLQTAVEGLAQEIRSGLQQGLEDMITRAVAQEITRLQSAQK
jgi:hypothetical protein